MPHIPLDGNNVKKTIIEELQEIMDKTVGKQNTETNLIYLQTEIDNLFNGKRLFKVQRKYNTYKEKAKLWGSEEVVDIERQQLDPYTLEVVFVGSYNDLFEYPELFELLCDVKVLI